MKSYKALVLDFDGTLASTLEDVALCMVKTFRAFGLPPPTSGDVLPTMGLPLEEAFRKLLGGGCSAQNLQEWVRVYRDLYASSGAPRTRLFPGAAEFLGRAHANGVRTVLVSNKGKAAIHLTLSRLGVLERLTMVLAGDSSDARKPDPLLYQYEIRPKIQPCSDEEVLVVGDTEIDLQFANNCGLDSCWVSYGYGNPEKCLACGPTYVADSLPQIMPVISEGTGRRL
jgi:phosphoglycolate phosphatase